jgi:hypothetical protein
VAIERADLAELHERAFRRLCGTVRVIVLDNLKEGVLTPDIYDPALNPLNRDVLAHHGVVALPCRVGDPDQKGKVEAGVGHAQKTRCGESASRVSKRRRVGRIHGSTARRNDRSPRCCCASISGLRRAGIAFYDEDRPARTPASTIALLVRAKTAGPHISAACEYIHQH